MMNYEKKKKVIDTLTHIARLWHDGHDAADARKKGLSTPIALEQCERQHCQELLEVLAIIGNIPPSSFGL